MLPIFFAASIWPLPKLIIAANKQRIVGIHVLTCVCSSITVFSWVTVVYLLAL